MLPIASFPITSSLRFGLSLEDCTPASKLVSTENIGHPKKGKSLDITYTVEDVKQMPTDGSGKEAVFVSLMPVDAKEGSFPIISKLEDMDTFRPIK